MSSFILYKVVGPVSKHAYYGYAAAEDMETALSSFITGATRTSGGDRGARDLANENDGDVKSLVLHIVESFDNEFDAFLRRNDVRATEPWSINGPSNFPASVFTRVGTEAPGRQAAWTKARQIRDAKTARDAYALGAWTFAQVKMANIIKTDLDTLTPIEFSVKYNLEFTLEIANAA